MMKTLSKSLPHETEITIKMALNEAEMISGRSLTDDQKGIMIRFLMDDIKTKFSWLTAQYLQQAIRAGLSSEYKYLDYKTICKWLWDFKNSPEMGLKIALNAPLASIDLPESATINWQMEANKAYHRYLNGNFNESYVNTGVYGRLILDGFIQLNAYYKYYKPNEGEEHDITKVSNAQRKIIADMFLKFKETGMQYIYNPAQFFKQSA